MSLRALRQGFDQREGRRNPEEEEGSSSGSELAETNTTTPSSTDELVCAAPCRHHPLYAKYPDGLGGLPHLPSLTKFAADVSRAVKNSFPRLPRQYEKAHAVFIYWEHDDIGTLSQIGRLKDHIERLRITISPPTITTSTYILKPREDEALDRLRSRLELQLLMYRMDFGLEEDSLLIVYYGGHGKMEGGKCIWYATRDFADCKDRGRILNWTPLASRLIEGDGNILFIVDSCSAAGMGNLSAVGGIKELLAACGKNDTTSASDSNAFTTALIDELADLEGSEYNIATLGARLLAPRYNYLIATPLRVPLSLKATTESLVFHYGASTAAIPAPSEVRNVTQQALDTQTRILVAIRLENPTVTPRVRDWATWIRSFAPAGIAGIDVDLAYIHPVALHQSRSTLLIASLPVTVWNLMPPHPSYTFIDLVESDNLLSVEPSLLPEPELQQIGAPGKMQTPSVMADLGEALELPMHETNKGKQLPGPPPSEPHEALIAPAPGPAKGLRRILELTSRRKGFDSSSSMADLQRDTVLQDQMKTKKTPLMSYFKPGTSTKGPALISRRPAPHPPLITGELTTVPAITSLRSRSVPKQQIMAFDVRLLCIEPGADGDPLSLWLQLISVGHLSQVMYEAVSHAWDYDAPREEVKIRIGEDGGLYTYREVDLSLIQLLKLLRRADKTLFVWLDAVCIDWSDWSTTKTEVRRQLSFIPQIFANADLVHIWFPKGWGILEGVLPILANVLRTLDPEESLLRDVAGSFDTYMVLRDLLSHPWFTRRWIVQEIVLAQEARVHFGSKEMAWETFAGALELLLDQQLLGDVALIRDKARSWGGEDRLWGIPHLQRARTLLSLSLHHRRNRRRGRAVEPQHSLEYLVCALKMFFTNDPRDVVYACLSLANISGPEISPDYSKDTAQVYRDFVARAVKESQSLDIICRPWAPLPNPKTNVHHNESFSLPSWIQSVNMADLAKQGREDDESFVGLPGSARYSASGNRTLQVTFGDEQDDSVMIARGIWLGEVAAVSLPMTNGVIQWHPFEHDITEGAFSGNFGPAFRRFQSENLAGGKVRGWGFLKDKLWRVLVADRGLDGAPTPSWYPAAFAYVSSHLSTWKGLEIATVLAESGTMPMPNAVRQYLERAMAVIDNRVFLIMRNGEFGLGPLSTKVGDIVCILFGCSVPVILRPRSDGYVLIGESYIEGVMAGEESEAYEQGFGTEEATGIQETDFRIF